MSDSFLTLLIHYFPNLFIQCRFKIGLGGMKIKVAKKNKKHCELSVRESLNPLKKAPCLIEKQEYVPYQTLEHIPQLLSMIILFNSGVLFDLHPRYIH